MSRRCRLTTRRMMFVRVRANVLPRVTRRILPNPSRVEDKVCTVRTNNKPPSTQKRADSLERRLSRGSTSNQARRLIRKEVRRVRRESPGNTMIDDHVSSAGSSDAQKSPPRSPGGSEPGSQAKLCPTLSLLRMLRPKRFNINKHGMARTMNVREKRSGTTDPPPSTSGDENQVEKGPFPAMELLLFRLSRSRLHCSPSRAAGEAPFLLLLWERSKTRESPLSENESTRDGPGYVGLT